MKTNENKLVNAISQNQEIDKVHLKELKRNSIELFNYFSDKIIEAENKEGESKRIKKRGNKSECLSPQP